jgi:hypothetical protein
MMKITLLTTCMISGAMPEVLLRLLNSIDRQIAAMPGDEISLILLLQNCAPEAVAALHDFPSYVTPIASASKMSLSAARNILLREAFARNRIESETIVAFPDDDCWYPDRLLPWIRPQFSADGSLDFFFCSYASKPRLIGEIAAQPRLAKARDVIRGASSNTIFLRGSTARAVGLFDEDLGVGTRNNGGEDIEYALRVFLKARKTLFLEAQIVGHRDKMPGLRAKYYRGSLLAIRRHAASHPGIALEYARKIAVGGALALKGEMPPAKWLGDNFAGHSPLPPSPFAARAG